jgi:hypothetical protein
LRGSYVETFFPSFLWSASTTYSLWTIISDDLCERRLSSILFTWASH